MADQPVSDGPARRLLRDPGSVTPGGEPDQGFQQAAGGPTVSRLHPGQPARVGAVATSYRKKAKRTVDASAPAVEPARPKRTAVPRGGAGFKLASPYQPAGDQPKAIDELVDGLTRGDEAQVLLGITGSGKTYTIANAIAAVDRPTLIIAH